MYWSDQNPTETFVVPDDVVDALFTISCRCLPIDHAHALRVALLQVLPWLADEEGAGIHQIHVAESGNGWMRPEHPDDLLYLSRRTKLALRLPKNRIADAGRLSGVTLDVAGNRLSVAGSSVRPLSAITTIFARYVLVSTAADEEAFLATTMVQLGDMGIKPKKMMCGMENAIATPDGNIRTRSLMLADLTREESVRLQQLGLGPLRQLGCGLFIPHKDIDEVGRASN
ncbi:MAG: type I-MYXAN CRISPR-associated protein Cas6/Cmx6 [Acidiferrobacterales bacterium]